MKFILRTHVSGEKPTHKTCLHIFWSFLLVNETIALKEPTGIRENL